MIDAEGKFAPPPPLRHGHVQSVLASLKLRRYWLAGQIGPLEARSRDLIVDCGDGTRLLAVETPSADPDGRLAVLIHGWEGSARSLYLVSAAAALHAAGYEVVRLNLRDHGDSHHLNEGLFHSNRIAEVVGAVKAIAERYPGRSLCLAGFSLGGNFALRVAARASRSGLVLARVVAVCPVLDPRTTLGALEQGWFVYRHYFLAKWRRSLRKKAASHPGLYAFGDLGRFRSLTEMTDFFVAGYTDYPDLETYLGGYAITGDALDGIDTTAHILAAADDPVIPVADLDQLARPSSLTVEVCDHGGHCGFVDRPGSASWADRRIIEVFGTAF